MKISIITICYNDPDIKKTCESIANQTFQEFEWIVVDGGSDQETLEILNDYRKRINVFISEKDTGIYNAMNKGIKLASGDYLHFLNAGDCYFSKTSLNQVLNFLGNSDIVFGDLKFIQVENSFTKKYPESIPYGWLKSNNLPHPASFIKKELFDKYGLYDEKNKIVSDLKKWIEFIDINKCSYEHVSLILAIHNYNGISSILNEEYYGELIRVKAKYYGLHKEVIINCFKWLKVFLKRVFNYKQHKVN